MQGVVGLDIMEERTPRLAESECSYLNFDR